MSVSFSLRPEYASRVRWHAHTHCGEAGCTDRTCSCSFCGNPVGVAENDPRWMEHDEECCDCDLCRDQVPLILFRGEGQDVLMARFHENCARIVIDFHSAP